LPFRISGKCDGVTRPIGICRPDKQIDLDKSALRTSNEGATSRDSSSFSIPINCLADFAKNWKDNGQAWVTFTISPDLPEIATEYKSTKLSGTFEFLVRLQDLKKSRNGFVIRKVDVMCRADPQVGRSVDPLVVQVQLKMILGDELHPQVEVCLEPRAIVENKIPVGIQIRTPMPHTFCSSAQASVIKEKDSFYVLRPGDRIEVFTPGPSIAVTLRISEKPVAGSSLDWLDEGWIDLPLVSQFRLLEPISCLFPFSNDDSVAQVGYGARGNEFYIAEGFESLIELGAIENEAKGSISPSKTPETQRSTNEAFPQRTFFVTVRYYGVDHTGDILFEQTTNGDLSSSFSDIRGGGRRKASGSRPFSAFASARHRRRISLLPAGDVPIRLLQLTMEQDVGWRRSMVSLLDMNGDWLPHHSTKSFVYVLKAIFY
jgi:hypothetical protein